MPDTREKINIIDLEINQDAALKAASDLHEKMVELKDETTKLEKSQKALRDQGQQNSQQYANNAKQIVLNKAEMKNLTAEYNVQQKVVADVLKTGDKELGTLEKLTLRNKQLREELRGLNLDTEEGKKRRDEINTEVDKNTEIIRENSDAMVKQRMNIGNYQSALDGLPGALGKVNTGIKGMIQTAKAFIATPIGAIILAIVAAVKLMQIGFKGSQYLMDEMSVGTSKLKATFEVLRDRISETMETWYKKIKGDPISVLKDLGKALVDQVLNRLEAMPKIAIKAFEALKQTIKGNTEEAKKAAAEMAQAFAEFRTGLDEEQQKKVAEATKSLTKEIREEALAAAELKRRSIALRDSDIELITTRASLRREIEKNKLAVKDSNKTIEERLAASEKAGQLELELLAKEKASAVERAAIKEQEMKLSKSTAEDYQELAELKAKAIDLETQYFSRQKELITERGSLEKQLKDEGIAQLNEYAEAYKKWAESAQGYIEQEIDIWKLRNKSAIDSNTVLTEEIVNNEKARLDHLETMQKDAVEKAFERELITEQDKALQILQIESETAEQKKALQDDYNKYLIESAEDTAARIFDVEMTALENKLGSEFDIKYKSAEKWYSEQIKLAKGNADQISSIEKAYANVRKQIDRDVLDAKVEGVSMIMGYIKDIVGENTIAYKAASTVQIAADTYKAAMGAYAAMAGIPVVGPGLGIAAGIAATAAGGAAIKKVWSADVNSGVSSIDSLSTTSAGVVSEGIPDAVTYNDGGLVSRDTSASAGESLKKSMIEALNEADVREVAVVDRITADQKGVKYTENLASV